MSEHKVDKEIEDILQHYGVKGMKWKVRKSQNELASSENGGGGDGEADESALEEMKDKLNDTLSALDKKLGKLSDKLKKKGKDLLASIFGKSETKYSKAKPDAKTTKRFKDAMKSYDKASPVQREALKKGYTVKAESSTKSGGTSTSFKTKSGNSYTGKTVTNKEYNSVLKKLEKEGMKKTTIKTGKTVKNKDGSVTKKIGDNTYNFKVDKSKK